MGHLERYNLLNPNQHGYRPNYLFQTQLILLVEDILSSFYLLKIFLKQWIHIRELDHVVFKDWVIK